ncbi:Translationally-controlled tumor protein [Hibiscus syriacus]|uniref:Translationally-controlled tumor protein n=1 Tax=Hibiscus syriacus TaxID=106335 RepID=A0A6A3A511_HIBSY|nr:universal stress protein PHOS34-like isoform X2 [Hibiscus syriacus]KAE8698239.1 Translationally-controlled tumor protein [Hibiscus syriacus]
MASEKHVMLIAVDDSAHSMYALEWTLDHFFVPFGSLQPFQLVAIHARPIPISILQLAGPATAEIIPMMEVDLKKTAARITEKVKELCKKKSVNEVDVEVMEGDPRNVLCEAVDKYNAKILVVGSHGYGPMKRAVLGSVSDYCAHHAHSSVMIVKKPKT